ncbi:MAG: S4 domain-containing protein [Candidatus Cloacimonadales bacterium]
MRIDQLLNKICVIKTRSIANQACRKGLIEINNQVAKASSTVKDGDTISVKLNGYKTVIKITQIPQGNVSKKNALDYYELLTREALILDV